MNREQLDQIPDSLLRSRRTNRLLEWLESHGWQMSLEELHAERSRREITPR